MKSAPAQQPQEVKCPGKGGAKRSAGAYASDFYDRGRGEAHSTLSPRSWTFRQERRAVAERRFSPRRKSARWQDALSRGRRCHAWGHAGHPRPTMRGRQRGTRRAEAHPPGAGDTPSAKRRRRQRGLDTAPGRVRAHKRGRVDATPPPCQKEALYAAGRCQARESRDRGDITPTPQRFWLR